MTKFVTSIYLVVAAVLLILFFTPKKCDTPRFEIHLTLQNQHSEGNSEQFDGRVDSLAADGQFVDILHRLTTETRRTVYGYDLTV